MFGVWLSGRVPGDKDNPGNSEANTRPYSLADGQPEAGGRVVWSQGGPGKDARSDRDKNDPAPAGSSGSCDVLLTYQLDGSVTDMLWLQRVQRIRVRSWRVGLRDCSYF